MDQISATRSELLARRTRITLATNGRDLLKDRRSVLVREFHRIGARALESLAAVDRSAAQAAQRLGLTSGDGCEPLESAALAAATGIEVVVNARSVAGVPIVELTKNRIGRSPTARGYSLAASGAGIDSVAVSFESVLDQLLDVAALELSVRRLAEEIARTTRRMNALDHVVLPRLNYERMHIALALDERETQDRIRLRRGRSQDGRRRDLR
jgi:V/A-type H+/Na+-transporting ATPase subunit D